MKDSAFKDGYLETETKSYKNECNKQVEKDCFIAPMASVNVLSFVCSFCVVQIFALVAKFEKLASIGSKKRMFIKQKDNNEVLCTVKVLINKYYSKLSLHCANDDLRPSMKNVCLDIRNGRAAASDGHTMMIKGLDVVSTEHFTYDYNLPLVNGKDLKRCAHWQSLVVHLLASWYVNQTAIHIGYLNAVDITLRLRQTDT